MLCVCMHLILVQCSYRPSNHSCKASAETGCTLRYTSGAILEILLTGFLESCQSQLYLGGSGGMPPQNFFESLGVLRLNLDRVSLIPKVPKNGLDSTSEHLNFQKISGAACPQTPLDRAGFGSSPGNQSTKSLESPLMCINFPLSALPPITRSPGIPPRYLHQRTPCWKVHLMPQQEPVFWLPLQVSPELGSMPSLFLPLASEWITTPLGLQLASDLDLPSADLTPAITAAQKWTVLPHMVLAVDGVRAVIIAMLL